MENPPSQGRVTVRSQATKPEPWQVQEKSRFGSACGPPFLPQSAPKTIGYSGPFFFCASLRSLKRHGQIRFHALQAARVE
jgi:hypothetical protein